MIRHEIGRICAVWQRDFRSLFITPIGYVFIALFFAVMNLIFYLSNILESSANLESTFSSMLVVLMFLTLLLTMRLFPEEVKQQTDRLLFTTSIRVGSVVLGKFLASLSVFAIALCVIPIWVIVLSVFGRPSMPSILGNTIAVFFSGSAFIAIGVLVSALTESQVIAAICTFSAYLFVFVMDYVASSASIGNWSRLIQWFSLFSRYNRFSLGVFSLADIAYYLSVTVVFLLITIRVLQAKYHA